MDVIFWFKKTFSRLIFPAPLVFYPLVIGVLLIWFGRTPRLQRAGKILVTTGVALYLVLTATSVPDMMLRSLEDNFRSFDVEEVRREKGGDWEPSYVVVLGGDFNPTIYLPVTSRVGPLSTTRVSEGVRIHQLFPDSTLIFTGGPPKEKDQSAGEGMAELAELWGVNRDHIIVEGKSRDTKDHVHYLQETLQGESFVVVTTASHLPRAVALFKHAGLDPVGAPVNFQAHDKFSFRAGLPGAQNLAKAECAFYEYLGIFWAKLRGQI